LGEHRAAAHRADPQLAELGLKLISWPPTEILPAINRWWHFRIWRARPARFLVHLGWLALNSTRRLRHSVARVICCEGEILPKYDLVKISSHWHKRPARRYSTSGGQRTQRLLTPHFTSLTSLHLTSLPLSSPHITALALQTTALGFKVESHRDLSASK
jgi:hypothetical protein